MKLWRHVSLDHVTFDEKNKMDASVVVSIVSHIPAPFFMSMIQRRIMLIHLRYLCVLSINVACTQCELTLRIYVHNILDVWCKTRSVSSALLWLDHLENPLGKDLSIYTPLWTKFCFHFASFFIILDSHELLRCKRTDLHFYKIKHFCFSRLRRAAIYVNTPQLTRAII